MEGRQWAQGGSGREVVRGAWSRGGVGHAHALLRGPDRRQPGLSVQQRQLPERAPRVVLKNLEFRRVCRVEREKGGRG